MSRGLIRRKIDNFYLVEPIGSGGMSDVFLAINPKTREKRAYKILGKRVTQYSSAYARFIREVDIIRALSHPNIIRIMDNGVLEDCYYYSMEFMPGGNLNRLLKRGRISVKAAMRLFIPICDAVACAHEKGIVHRDLKPSNILLNGSGEPIISDFGIAKVLDIQKTTLTRSGEILGTIAYLAPEQRCSSKNVDRRADVYALGAMLYEMLMGFPPLGKFPWPADVHANFNNSLQMILERCLAREPEERFQHAGILRVEIDKCQEFSNGKSRETRHISLSKDFSARDVQTVCPVKTDRIETWFSILRNGTTRERLGTVREMVETINPSEAKAILKLYSGEGDRVRWGLIRAFGDLKIKSAVPLILSDLESPFHTECAIEALGKIGMDEAYDAISEHILKHPESAIFALLPLAQTGKHRSAKFIRHYLNHEMAVLRQAAIRALRVVPSEESLRALKEQLEVERDDKVRTSLLQVVRSLEAMLLPHISFPEAETIESSKSAS